MASISLPRVLSHRKSGSIEVERETFWKSQTASIGKAINSHESPVKEKHVRSAIIGTYHEKGGTTFWAVVGSLPIQENPIVCWKFCHTLHKLLREGHPNVLPESQTYRQRIRELGKYWGHLRHNFGRLISCYCRLLATKLEFHYKNPKFPGNMQLTNEQLDSIGEMDVNNYFQITVEMFDFMDEILTLQAAVFGSLESGRANSMTMSGQCRLAPLIPCIQDSSHLYDYLVKLLFKLHSCLPSDVLLGHRDRFYKQFKVLKEFYKNASILQYFKHLIQIPLLPEEPPNFLIKSEIHSHVSPVVILPQQDDSADTDSIDMSLIDTTSSPLLELDSSNGASSSPDMTSDKDRLIERLEAEIERLKRELQRIQLEDQKAIDELRHQLAAAQGKLSALQQQLLAKNGEIELLRAKTVSAEENSKAVEKLSDVEKKAKGNEEKFQKMKDVYYKLREEHITLLRAKADVEKQLIGAKQASQTTDKDKSEILLLKQQLEEAKRVHAEMEVQTKDIRRKRSLDLEVSDVDDDQTMKKQPRALYADKKKLEAMLQESLRTTQRLNDTFRNELKAAEELMAVEMRIQGNMADKSEVEAELGRKVERSSSVIGQLSLEKDELTKTRTELDRKLAVLADEQMELESTSHENPKQSAEKLDMLTKLRDKLEIEESEVETKLKSVAIAKEAAELDLNQQMEISNERLSELDQLISKLQQEKLNLEQKVEINRATENDLQSKLNDVQNWLNEKSADNQELDELLMMAVDEMYLKQEINNSNPVDLKDLQQLQLENDELKQKLKEFENKPEDSELFLLKEDKQKLNTEKRDLESKLNSVINEEKDLEEILRKNKSKQQLGIFADSNDEEKLELEELLMAAIDENYIAQQLLDENLVNSDESQRNFAEERNVLKSKIALLEGKLENTLRAKFQIEDSYKGNSELNSAELGKLIEIKSELEDRVRELSSKIEGFNESEDREELVIENKELEELLMTAIDEARIAEELLNEQKIGTVEQYSLLNIERAKLKKKVLELEGRLENIQAAKKSIESSFVETSELSAVEFAKILDTKAELDQRMRDVTQELHKIIAEKEKDNVNFQRITKELELKTQTLVKENQDLEDKLQKVKDDKSALEASLAENLERNQKQLGKMAEKHHELDLEKQELEEMLLAALDEKYTELNEESEQREKERFELLEQHKILKMKSLELEGKLSNALNAKLVIEKAFKSTSEISGEKMAEMTHENLELEQKFSETLAKLELLTMEKEIADRKVEEKTEEAAKQVSALLKENQELQLKVLGLEENLSMITSDKQVLESNLQRSQQKLASELEQMERKQGDLDLEKQELEELLMAAVDEKYTAEQSIIESSEVERMNLTQERNILRRKVMELEGKLENALLAKNSIQQSFQENSTKLGQQLAFMTNEKYILEEEILNLRMKLSSESDAMLQSQQTQIEKYEKLNSDLNGNVTGLEQQLMEVSEQKITLEQQMADLTGNVARLESEIESLRRESDQFKQQNLIDSRSKQVQVFVSCVDEAEIMVKNALKNVDDDAASPLTCSPEYLLNCGQNVIGALDRLKNNYFSFKHQNSDVDETLRSLSSFSHRLSEFLIEGKATFNSTADIEQGTQLLSACKDSGTDTLALFSTMKKLSSSDAADESDKWTKVEDDIRNCSAIVESLISLTNAKMEDKIEDLVEKELLEMDKAIEEATARIAEILSKSRQAETGIKLEVSEKILDTCTALMEAIRLLVKKSKGLQIEIVAQGKGHKSVKEFYKKNHQWTEGLLSAAKAVGMGAKFLVDAADKVVTGQAKFELLVAASQEIAASTAQLVVASKVKADPGSQNLAELSKASGNVRGCTATVVATVKDCSQMIDEADVMDFSGLSLHQAKRLEMESQVKVLELETKLEKERVRLSALRKRHYGLAGPGGGWEQEDSQNQ